MELADVWEKIAKRIELTPQEMDFLKGAGRETQKRNAQIAGWTNADGTANLLSPRISSPIFATNALSTFKLTRTTNTAITTGTDTAVAFERQEGFETAFIFDLADATKIFLAYPGQAFCVMGIVGWAGDVTGYRNLKLVGFDQNDNNLGSAVLNSHAGFSGTDNVFPYCYAIPQNALPTMAYFKFTVGHTKGANLNLLFLDLAMFVL